MITIEKNINYYANVRVISGCFVNTAKIKRMSLAKINISETILYKYGFGY